MGLGFYPAPSSTGALGAEIHIFTRSLQFKIQRRPGSHTRRLKPRVVRALDSGCTACGSAFLGPHVLPTLLLSLLLWVFSTRPPAPGAASFGSWWFPDSPWLQLGTHLPPPQALSPGPGARQAPGGEGALDEHPLLLHPGFPLLPPLTPPPMLPLMMEEGLEGVSEIIYTRTYKN